MKKKNSLKCEGRVFIMYQEEKKNMEAFELCLLALVVLLQQQQLNSYALKTLVCQAANKRLAGTITNERPANQTG